MAENLQPESRNKSPHLLREISEGRRKESAERHHREILRGSRASLARKERKVSSLPMLARRSKEVLENVEEGEGRDGAKKRSVSQQLR